MATALTSELTRFTDKCNKVLAGGTVKTFEPNSLIPKITYQDPNKEIPNLEEVILDETGRAKIYISGDYRIQIYSRDGILIEDNLLVEQTLVQRDFVDLSQSLQTEQQETLNQFQAKADEVIAQGFYKGFATEALLLAAKPVVAEMRARADDTRKIWRWNRTSAEGVMPVTGTWTDTGPSDVDKAVDEFLAEAQRQGVSLQQLNSYYNYLMQQLAQVAIDRGWAASFIVSADGSTQQEINDFGGAKWRNKPLGYDIGSTVKLENGDIVRSTVANNTVNPNVDMSGWFLIGSDKVSTVEDLIGLQVWNGRTVRTKSYHANLEKGGSLYIYDSTKSSINNAVTIINGWCLQYDGRICVTQAGCKLDGLTDDSIAFNNCSALNLPMKYTVSGTLQALSSLNFNTNGLVGTGIFSVIDVVGGHDGIILPLGGGRLFQNIENFRLISSDNSAIDHIAIRSKETTLNSQSLGNGFKIRNIEIGGGGRFGVGIALTDCFRATIEDVGMTSVANAVVLYGQVVQCKLGVITSNNIRDFTTTALNKLGTLSSITRIDKTRRYGLLVCGSSHRENTYLRPESIKSKDNSYVKHDVGLFQHDALYAVYKDIDLDYNGQYAAEFYSCDGLTKLDTVWCANDSGASHGIFIDTSTINPKRLVLKDIHAFAYGELQANSACIYQNSAVSYRRGVTVDGLTLGSNFWTNAINFTRSRNFSIKNVVEEGVPISNGVVLNNCRDFDYFDSDVAQSVITSATSKYRIDNISGTVTVNSNGGTYELSTSSEKKFEGKGLTIAGGQGFAVPLKTNFGYLWMRAGNVLMFKAGTTAPTSETDGVVVSRGLEGSASITAQTIAASSKYTVAVAVAGAATGYPCVASFNQSLKGCSIRAEITAAGTATATIFNDNAASVTLDAGTITVKVV